MYKVFLKIVLFYSIFTIACFNESQPKALIKQNVPAIYFPEGQTIDFDTIFFDKMNNRIKRKFEFSLENQSIDTLVIVNVRGSGGPCAPSFDRIPIPPNGKSKVYYECDFSIGRAGKIGKNLYVQSNFGDYKLRIQGYILRKE